MNIYTLPLEELTAAKQSFTFAGHYFLKGKEDMTDCLIRLGNRQENIAQEIIGGCYER